ncbi:hypothetical protein A3K73_05665 [Candidatus Pacearchaeota archaeon RBG_13_36_9]|nr:MAG: hypothetical protein A3K73_05665 [Candidatus Pacearchaeota archaeon RBG_13_36_9]
MEILKDLFDEKIVRIINLFMENPEKNYFLTDVANLAKVNITTTFRILNKLSEKGFLKTKIIGKVRFYQLDQNEKTKELMNLLKKDGDPLQKFIETIASHPRSKKIILESKEGNAAKLLVVGDFLPQEKINKLVQEIKDKYNFRINYVEISEAQYIKLREFKNYNLEQKIIWQRKSTGTVS